MNFEHMPEPRAPWGYFAVLATMAFVAAGMLYYFSSRGWLGHGRRSRSRRSAPTPEGPFR